MRTMRKSLGLWPSSIRRAALLVPVLVLGAMGQALAAPDPAQSDFVTLDVAREALQSGRAVLIDIREPEEHARGVAPGARLLPMSQLRRRVLEIPVDPAKPVYLICNSQNRSAATLKALRPQGYGHVRYVEGGMSEWTRRGWTLVKPAL
jgi:rhodanese-related sulfurtransferase